LTSSERTPNWDDSRLYPPPRAGLPGGGVLGGTQMGAGPTAAAQAMEDALCPTLPAELSQVVPQDVEADG
jgi:hypothetical protein